MPVPTIFLIDNNNQIIEMKDQPYDSEGRLQNFLAMFPSVLAGDQMSGIAPLKWLLIKREAGIPGEDGGAERWSVDHLFVDQNGIPTIVEVKRSTDTRIRREVVGQMLDYAANAVQYWPIETLQQWFAESCAEGVDPNVNLATAIGLTDASDEAITQFWQTVETNLRAGRVRLVFAADEIPPELRRIIEFLDEHMTPTEVFGIEIRQYVGTNGQTLVPTVIRSSRKSTPTTGRTALQWDEESFIRALHQRKGAELVAVAKRIMHWAARNGLTLSWGKGRFDGSCFVGADHRGIAYYPVAMWTSGTVQLQCQTLQQRGTPVAVVEKLTAALNTIPGVQLPADALSRFPSFEMALLEPSQAFTQFVNALGSFFEQVRTPDKASWAVAGSD